MRLIKIDRAIMQELLDGRALRVKRMLERIEVNVNKNLTILSCETSSIYKRLIKVSLKEILVSSFIRK